MRKILLMLIAIFAISLSANAQVKGKIRGGLDLGYAMPKGGHGVAIGAELKYNILSNLNAGFRFEAAGLAKNIAGAKDYDSFDDADLTFNFAYLAVADYYFPLGSSRFAPFAGAGFGYYQFADIEIGDAKLGGDSGKFGGLVRAGFEYRKFRFSATYNIIPKTKLTTLTIKGQEDVNLEDLGEGFRNQKSENQYFSFSVGFYIGGGSWKR